MNTINETKPTNVANYLENLPDDKAAAFLKLRETILSAIPEGFEEALTYGMVSYVVPHRIFPAGYHCDPKLPLGFASIACQKNFIALYHMGIYADKNLLDWFVGEYPKHCDSKLDMGKSCIRFKKLEKIPHALIAELMQKMSAQEWIDTYQSILTKSK